MAENNKKFFVSYLQESFEELKKVTWPTRNQAVRLTFIVIGFCLVTAFVIGALDFAFNTGYRSFVIYADKMQSTRPSAAPTPSAPVKAAPADPTPASNN